MLTFSFFATMFACIMWLVYVCIYLSVRLAGIDLTSLGLVDTALYTAIIFLPLAVFWSIWGRFYNLSHEKKLQKQLNILSSQLTQNREYSDVMARIMLKNCQQQVHAFALSKVDLYISEMNEILSDVLQRYEFLDKTYYNTVIRTVAQGNRWGFAKAVVDLYNKDSEFEKKLTKSARSHPLLAGSITEFCANYTRLLRLLKDHDEDNILQDIIETGALGKVFAVFAAVVRNLHEPEIEEEVIDIKAYRDTGPELRDDERFFKDDDTSDDEDSSVPDDLVATPKRPNLLKKIIARFKPTADDNVEDEKEHNDPLSIALERSFGDEPTIEAPSFLSAPQSDDVVEQVIHSPAPAEGEEDTSNRFAFDSTTRTIKNLQKEWEDMKKNNFAPTIQDKTADE